MHIRLQRWTFSSLCKKKVFKFYISNWNFSFFQWWNVTVRQEIFHENSQKLYKIEAFNGNIYSDESSQSWTEKFEISKNALASCNITHFDIILSFDQIGF